MSGTVVDALTWWARTVPEHPAIDFDGDVVSCAELDTWADGVAGGLRDRGVAAGDRVGIVGANTLEWCVAAVAAWKLGAAPRRGGRRGCEAHPGRSGAWRARSSKAGRCTCSRGSTPRALEVLEQGRITTFTGPPILFEQIARVPGFDDVRLDHLTIAWVGGARGPVPLVERWRPRGVALRQMYGQTEIGGGATAMSAEGSARHPDKCGWGGTFTRIRVVDADGQDCAPGEVGEIIMRGPGMFPGYWRNAEATAKALRGGWLHTGDLGTLDEEGLLTYVDRMGEMINDRLADYKVPRYVIAHDGPLPRMASGKIAKRDLRGVYADAPQRFPKVR